MVSASAFPKKKFLLYILKLLARTTQILEKDVLCATMAVTTTMVVDLGFSWVFLGVFPFDFLSYSCYRKKN